MTQQAAKFQSQHRFSCTGCGLIPRWEGKKKERKKCTHARCKIALLPPFSNTRVEFSVAQLYICYYLSSAATRVPESIGLGLQSVLWSPNSALFCYSLRVGDQSKLLRPSPDWPTRRHAQGDQMEAELETLNRPASWGSCQRLLSVLYDHARGARAYSYCTCSETFMHTYASGYSTVAQDCTGEAGCIGLFAAQFT